MSKDTKKNFGKFSLGSIGMFGMFLELEHLEKASPSLDPELQTGIFGIFLEIPSNQIPLEKLRSPKNLGTLMEDFSMPRKKTLEKLEIRRI